MIKSHFMLDTVNREKTYKIVYTCIVRVIVNRVRIQILRGSSICFTKYYMDHRFALPNILLHVQTFIVSVSGTRSRTHTFVL